MTAALESIPRPASLASDSRCETGPSEIVRAIFNRIGDKWTLLVIRELDDEPQRFTVLRKRVDGISQRMLTLTLRQLEREGLVHRNVLPEVPPRVEYSLTALGATLVPHVIALANWALSNEQQIRSNRLQFDQGLSPDGL